MKGHSGGAPFIPGAEEIERDETEDMSTFREIPPTAGFPLHGRDFLSTLADGRPQDCLERDFKRYLEVEYARVTCSGTAAFYLILETLKHLSSKRTVIVPSYICPLIPLAVRRAGLKVEVCDLRRDNFNFDLSGLTEICRGNGDLLAVLAVHLAGIPIDFAPVREIADRYGLFVVEDCAQSLGARYQGMPVGRLGDFSFFSLCRGKGLTTYEGGVIAASGPLGKLVDKTALRLIRKAPLTEALLVAKLLGYWIFYRPLLFWFVFRLPQAFWNWRGNRIKAAMEDFDSDFPLHEVSSWRRRLGHAQFARLETEIGRQREKASFYRERLQGIPGIRILEEPPGSRATYPFLTVLFEDPAIRTAALRALERSGFGGSFVYAAAIGDYDYLRPFVPERNCDGARHLSERTITLSTSSYLTLRDLEAQAEILRNLSADSVPALPSAEGSRRGDLAVR